MYRLALLVLIFSSNVFAAESKKKEAGVRLFAGTHQFAFDQANTLIESNGIDPINHDIFGGIEINQDLFGPFAAGLRYESHFANGRETADPPANPLDEKYASFNHSLILAMARMRVVQTKATLFEVFAGAGGMQAKLKIHSSSSQSYERPGENLGFATMAGATAGIGWGGFYLFGEVGMEWSKVSISQRPQGVSNSLAKFETNGTFGTVGLMFKGIPSFLKMGSGSSSSKK